MQPYLFPYIGYFQLMHAADKFVILDDVNHIKRGWINRNRILVNGKDYLFSIPIKNASQNNLILECELSEDPWKQKFLKTIEMNYKKSSEFEEVFPVISNIVNCQEKNLSRYIFYHFQKIFEFLQMEICVITSSSIYKTEHLKAQEKIIEICKKEKALYYINPIGGTELYDKKKFIAENIQLRFLKTNSILYKQNAEKFVPWLSIIDVLMFNTRQTIIEFLEQYTLIENE